MSSARRPGSSGSSRPTKSSSSSSSKPIEQLGLRQCVQQRLVKDVFDQAASADPGWKILVVDDTSMKVISAAVGMYDIMERKVTLVESLEKKRAPFKDMAAIYILAPTKESIALLLEDYANKTKVLYGDSVFLYFLGRIPENFLEQIKRTKHLIKRLKALCEININFMAREERAYIVDMPKSFKAFYLRNGPTPIELEVAEKLVTVCATLNEYPYIRYRQSSGICSSLASLFHLKMDEFVGANPNWWYHGSGKSENKASERDRSTLLLLDRASDCLTPLMHDFAYQAMVHDLLSMEGDKITYQAETADDATQTEAKDVLLNEKDKIWVELRGKHIAQCIEILSARIQEVVNSSTGSALGGKKSDGATMSLSQMASALKDLPEYREVMGKLSQHMHLSHECMDVFNRDALLDLSDVEQTLATGKEEDGRAPKLTEMISRVEGALLRMKDMKSRLRLVLIATISQNGLSSSDRDRLFRAAQLGREEMQALDNLETLGISTLNNTGSAGAGNRFFGKSKIQSSGSFDEDSEYASQRYVPALKSIVTELVSNTLSMEEYPSVVPMPDLPSSSKSAASSARRRGKAAEGSSRNKKKGATSQWSRTGNAEPVAASGGNYVGNRNLVFMVGGISYSELRVAREVMEKESRELVVGSTAFLSPSDFIDDLSLLSKN